MLVCATHVATANPILFVIALMSMCMHYSKQLDDYYAQFQCYISLSAVTVLGFVQTNVTIFESDGVVQLTVAITVPFQAPTFSLLVHTLDGTATGLLWCLLIMYPQLHTTSSLTMCLCSYQHMYIHTHIHTYFIHL